jgi:uncharacterized protein YbjT (DUF2867 family)
VFTVLGITGNVGGEVARQLLAAGQKVRGVVRDPGKAKAWADFSVELVTADINNASALTSALQGAEGVFLLVPPVFDPSPEFLEAHRTAQSLVTSLQAARPQRVLYLSAIGAQATRTNLLTQHSIIERALRDVLLPITFFRPGWFMENFAWDVASACSGVLPTFLQPVEKPVPMVATADIGKIAAELLQESWTGHRIVELEGPTRVTPKLAAATFSHLLGQPVKLQVVPRDTWQSIFISQGMRNPTPRMQMLDGFNEGWIEFEHGAAGARKGTTDLDTVLARLIDQQK